MLPARFLAMLLLAMAPLSAQDPASEPGPKSFRASETDALRAGEGVLAAVEGKIQRIGATPDETVWFLNMSPDREGFVGIVYGSDVANFPDGLEGYLGKTVRLTGTIRLFRDTIPQIVVKGPAQITVLPDEAEPSKD